MFKVFTRNICCKTNTQQTFDWYKNCYFMIESQISLNLILKHFFTAILLYYTEKQNKFL